VSGSNSNIAWFTPLGENLKSCLLTKAVLPELARRGHSITIYTGDQDWAECSDGCSSPETGQFEYAGQRVRHFLRAFQDDRERKFDFSVNNVEDSQRAAFCQIANCRWPGISFFHDANLNRLEHDKVSNATTGVALDEQLKEKFGDDALELGDFSARGWSLDIFDRYLPNGKEDFLNAGAAVATFENVCRVVSEHRKCFYSAFPLEPFSEFEARRLRKSGREKKDLLEEDFLICCYGSDPVRHAPSEVLLAIEAVIRNYPSSGSLLPKILWLVEDPHSVQSREIEESLKRSGLADKTSFFIEKQGSDEALSEALLASDLFLDVDFDGQRGATFPQLISRSLAIPIISSDNSLPFTLNPAMKRGFAVGLAETIIRVLSEPSLLSSISEATRASMERVSSPANFATEVERIAHLSSLKETLQSERESVQNLRRKLLQKVENEFLPHVWSKDSKSLFSDEY